MRKILMIFLISLVLNNCQSQEKKENMKTSQDIYILSREIKRFDKEPRYGAIVTTGNCSFEVLINDMPLEAYYDKTGGGLGDAYFHLNWDIEKSGPQKITVRLFPGFDKKTNTMKKTLEDNSGVSITIEKAYAGVVNNTFDLYDEEEIITYRTPQRKVNGKLVSTFAGTPYFEDSFTFNAEVPYNIGILENSEILFTKETEKLKKLEKEVVVKYNEIRDVYMKDRIHNI